MASIVSILLILFGCFFFSSYAIGAHAGTRFISEEEDIEFEKQLKLLNKPAIKSIRTKHGDMYDCVDFYKQPAFDHPLLKNHTFHPRMRPSIPTLNRENEPSKSKSSSKMSYIGLERVACPLGTVPIRRITKDDLIREKLHSKYSVLNTENPGTHYAVVQTKFDPKIKYNGGRARIGIYNPYVNVSQYSASRMKIQNGPESIHTGWMVNPILYGDNLTRLYIYTDAGQSRCFNTRCPGFVIVNNDMPIDAVVPISEERGRQVIVAVLVYKDQSVGNWWLERTLSNEKIGFWPERLFTNLADSATGVQWGGEVFSPPNVPSPQMGSGTSQYKFSNYVAYYEGISTINEANQIVDAVNTEEYIDSNCYDSIDVGFEKGRFGHVMYYGGPGGATEN